MKRIVYNKLSGGHSGEAIPVPIPNTEVKLSYADDTDICRERRLLPDFFIFINDIVFRGMFDEAGDWREGNLQISADLLMKKRLIVR